MHGQQNIKKKDNIAALSTKEALCYQEASSVVFSYHKRLTPDTSETAPVFSHCVFVFKLLVGP